MRQEVAHELLQLLGDDSIQSDAWWQGCPPANWLQFFLDKLEPPDREMWKTDALVRVCAKGFKSNFVHFACHAVTGECLSRLDLSVAGESLSFDAALLGTTDLSCRVCAADQQGPIVFLNACGICRPAPLNSAPSLPDRWLRKAGALAMISTLCEVPDFFAYVFAKKFYEFLFKERDDTTKEYYLADALLATRRYFMEEYNNPLGLAYVLHAYPGAYVTYDL
jgi:hypothetical protein